MDSTNYSQASEISPNQASDSTASLQRSMHIPNVAKEELQTPLAANALAAQDREPELAGDEAAVEQFVSKGHPSQTSTFAEKMANLSSELQDSQAALRASEEKTADEMSRLRQTMKDWGFTDEELDSNDNDVEDNTLEKLGDSLGTATTPEEARQFATAIADQFSNLCLEAEKNLNKVFDPETGDLRSEWIIGLDNTVSTEK